MLPNSLNSTYTAIFRLAALFIFTLSAFAHASPSLEDYAQLPATSLMSISPSGDRIAFRRVQDGRDLLVVYSLKKGENLRMLDASEVNPQSIYFLTDNDLVLVASERKKVHGFKGSFDVSTAFRLKIKSGMLEQLLTPGKKIYPGQTGLGSIVGMTPDGKNVFMPAFTSRDGDKGRSAVTATIGGIDANPNYSLMKVNIDKPSKIGPEEKGASDAIDYFLGRNGKILVQERYSNINNKHEILVPEGRSWRSIYELETPMRDINPVAISADQKHLVILNTEAGSDRQGYSLVSLADGSISDTGFSREDKDVEAVIKDKNRVALGVRYSGFTPSYHFFDKKVNAFMEKVIQQFPDHSVWLQSWSDSFDKVVVRVEGSSYADVYFLLDENLQPRFLSTQRPNVNTEDINPIGKLTYSAGDGLKIPTLVTIPRDQLSSIKNLPAIMLPHGGPESYDRLGFDWLAQALASQGYLVIQPQFRGSDGFGLAHTLAGYGEWGKKMQTDLSDGLKFFVEKGMVDPERVCIMGWSYGGYAALAGGAYSSELYKCVISINGVSDLPLMLQQEKSAHGRHHWVLSYWEKAIADGNASKEFLRAISPAYSAETFKAPVLLIHGERDEVVKIKQSKRMKSALEKAKVSVELIELEDDNHQILDGENRLKTVQHAIDFLNKHLKN